jgi:hypothetical protein
MTNFIDSWSKPGMTDVFIVIPAKAGIYIIDNIIVIPAEAGIYTIIP